MARGSGYFSGLKFCPKCGTKTLGRDGDPSGGRPEYTCRLCTFTFYLKPTERYIKAAAELKERATQTAGSNSELETRRKDHIE